MNVRFHVFFETGRCVRFWHFIDHSGDPGSGMTDESQLGALEVVVQDEGMNITLSIQQY